MYNLSISNSLNSVYLLFCWYKQPIVSTKQLIVFLVLQLLLAVLANWIAETIGFFNKFILSFEKFAKTPLNNSPPSSLKPSFLTSRWVPAQDADSKTVIKFLKRNIFCRFGTPRVLISDDGSHFCNTQLKKVLEHYGVSYKVTSAYHP